MDWNTVTPSLIALGGVLLGSLITLSITFINNRFQAKERDKDRLEQRREAKIQLALEITRDNIRKMEGAMDDALKSINILRNIREKQVLGIISIDEMKMEFDSVMAKNTSGYNKYSESIPISEKLAFTFGEEYLSEHARFNDLWIDYVEFIAQTSSIETEDNDMKFLEVTKSAGILHLMLEKKLISIRDTE